MNVVSNPRNEKQMGRSFIKDVQSVILPKIACLAIHLSELMYLCTRKPLGVTQTSHHRIVTLNLRQLLPYCGDICFYFLTK